MTDLDDWQAMRDKPKRHYTVSDKVRRKRSKANKQFKAGSDAGKKTRRQVLAETPAAVEQAKLASGAWDASGRPVVPPKRKTETRVKSS